MEAGSGRVSRHPCLLCWKAKHLHHIDFSPRGRGYDAIAKGGVVGSQQVLSVALSESRIVIGLS